MQLFYHHFPIKVQTRGFPVPREARMKKTSYKILRCLSNISTMFSAKFQGDKAELQLTHQGQGMCVTILSQQLHKPNVAMHKHPSKSHGHKNILFELKAAENRWRNLRVTPRCCLCTCGGWKMQSDLSTRN